MMPKNTTTSIPNPPSLKNPHHPTNIAIPFTAPTITNHPSPPSGLLLGISGVLLIVFRRGSWSHGSFQGLGLQFMGVLFKAREKGVMFFFWDGWDGWLTEMIIMDVDMVDWEKCDIIRVEIEELLLVERKLGVGLDARIAKSLLIPFFLVTLKELRKENSDGLNVKHSLDLSPHPVTVTTRIFIFLVESPNY